MHSLLSSRNVGMVQGNSRINQSFVLGNVFFIKILLNFHRILFTTYFFFCNPRKKNYLIDPEKVVRACAKVATIPCWL